jgi:anti-sigma regulatory factor (Ser/Thr protein kinase)
MVDTVTTPRVMSSHEPVPAVAADLRRRVRALLTGWGVRPEAVDDVLLVLEELVANVLDHAHTAFRVVVRVAGDVVHVAVRDHSTRSPRVHPYDPHAVRGRGLQLVTTLARSWGCEHHADGKTVWAELAA